MRKEGRLNIPILYEDEWLLIVDKPSGLLVIPTPRNEQRTLTSILNEDAKDKGKLYRLHPCHRLDKETSGAIIYAKGKAIQKKMIELFKIRAISKTYIAFALGNFTRQAGEIRIPIEQKTAITKYKVIENRKKFAIVEVKPVTGRTNQIRVHFKSIGHPLLGETKYAFRKDQPFKTKRLCLHAGALEFIHPVTKKLIKAGAGLAGYLRELLSQYPK
jgi:RluA family pseudouridine synthase